MGAFKTIAGTTATCGTLGGMLGGASLWQGHRNYNKYVRGGRKNRLSFGQYIKTKSGKDLKDAAIGTAIGGALVGMAIGPSVYRHKRRMRGLNEAAENIRRGLNGAAENIRGRMNRAMWEDLNKKYYEYFKNLGGFAVKSGNLDKAIKTLNINKSSVKTKAQVKKIFRAAAMKSHPDKGGSEDIMKEVVGAWTSIKNSGWFSKLAYERAPYIPKTAVSGRLVTNAADVSGKAFNALIRGPLTRRFRMMRSPKTRKYVFKSPRKLDELRMKYLRRKYRFQLYKSNPEASEYFKKRH